MCVFHIPSSRSANILPATGFLSLDRAYKGLGGSEGCSSQGSPREGFPCPRRGSQRLRPWSTAGSCTGCCSKGTETAGKSCCSRWSRKRGQVCSPRALCWWQQGYPEQPPGPLLRKNRKKEKDNMELIWGPTELYL